MLLLKIVVEGVYSFKTRQVFDLENISNTLITGEINNNNTRSNGAGKSSIMEVVPICFFGATGSRADTMDEIINDHCDTAYTEITFESNDGVLYQKIRQWGKKKQNILNIFKNDRWVPDSSGEEANERIIEILGLNALTFFSVVFLRQWGEISFIEGASKDRKTILRNLLNVNVYEKACTLAGQQHSKIMRLFEANKNKLEIFGRDLQLEQDFKDKQKVLYDRLTKTNKDMVSVGKFVNQLRKRISTIEAQKKQTSNTDDLNVILANLTNGLKNKKREIDYLKNDNFLLNNKTQLENNQRANRANYDRHLKSIKIHQKKMNLTLIDVKSLGKTVLDLREAKTTLHSRLSECTAKLEVINDKIEVFQSTNGICPVLNSECSQVNPKANVDYINALTQQQLKIETQIKSLKSNINSTITKISEAEQQYNNGKIFNQEVQEAKSEFTELNKIIVQYDVEYNLDKQKIEEVIQKIAQNTIRLKQLEEEYTKEVTEKDRLEEKLSKMVDTTIESELNSLTTALEAKEDSLEKYQKELAEYNQELGTITANLTRIDKLKSEQKILLNDRDELLKQLTVLDKLIVAFGVNGIQKNIMKNAVPELEDVSNKLLNIFCPDRDIQIKFDLDPVTKKGEAKALGGLDIIIRDSGVQRKLNLYSGGEKTRITFSILLALAELLSKRAGRQMQTLIIDERISGLDEQGINQFSEIIKIIRRWYNKLIVITHIPQLKEMFDHITIVEKTEEGSRLASD